MVGARRAHVGSELCAAQVRQLFGVNLRRQAVFESGFEDAVFITAAYGLGENVVQGAVNPDEYYVFKPLLTQGKPALIRRKLGDKALRMVYDEAGEARN
ncbi:MAG: PEP/pyruvate-binding domain-containing protein, partial [Thiohalorhabdaceae bacterium]